MFTTINKVLFLLLTIYIYKGIVGGIPKDSNIVEFDALDGKNIFYLPKNSFYTAIMSNGGSDDIKDKQKQEEKQRINEQLILESIGKANMLVIYYYCIYTTITIYMFNKLFFITHNI